MNKETSVLPEQIMTKIYTVRGQKVMIDRDLAELYGVETKMLKRQVKRNLDRFPKDFMFIMSENDVKDWRRQIGTSNVGDKMGLRYSPMAFTEQGVAMLSSVLKSKRAIAVNIQIIRLFTKMKAVLSEHQELLSEIEDIKQKANSQDEKIEQIFNYLNQFVEQKMKREKVGYKK
ncbi:MAG TPA: ORF6N domain-containing protein [Crocinitomicaceae bacterium]|nr:ORF6N domain-containing protein [Crocinitomicaceae bacterium]